MWLLIDSRKWENVYLLLSLSLRISISTDHCISSPRETLYRIQRFSLRWNWCTFRSYCLVLDFWAHYGTIITVPLWEWYEFLLVRLIFDVYLHAEFFRDQFGYVILVWLGFVEIRLIFDRILHFQLVSFVRSRGKLAGFITLNNLIRLHDGFVLLKD